MMFIIITLIIIFLVSAIVLYNKMVRERYLVREAYSGVDVQLKRRHELIPRLVEVTRGYARYEAKTLEEVIQLRSRSAAAQNVTDKGAIETGITQGFKSFLALVEQYPDLKADQGFIQLHDALVAVENQLQMARRYYNGAVRDYNTGIQSFPGVLLARAFQFKTEPFFEVELATERAALEVAL